MERDGEEGKDKIKQLQGKERAVSLLKGLIQHKEEIIRYRDRKGRTAYNDGKKCVNMELTHNTHQFKCICVGKH
eukprot:10644633-Ditylum_brightwellii.AAC.1